jgi:catechol 2,3-dioxygenase-like lactoylglutathione lyase family enzyme
VSFLVSSRRSFLALAGGVLATPARLWGAPEVPTLLDHILLGCDDLDRGIDFVEKHTGVRAAFGGVHPGRGTRNALLSLGEMHYLEIIAPDPQQSGLPDHHGLLRLSEPRLIGWAAHPGNLDQFSTRLRIAGIAFNGPTPGSRKRPDGRLLQWKTLNLKDDQGGLLPFFIEWSPDTLHPSVDAPGGCRVVHFSLSTPVPPELNRVCSRLALEVQVEKGENPYMYASIAGPNGRVMEVSS